MGDAEVVGDVVDDDVGDVDGVGAGDIVGDNVGGGDGPGDNVGDCLSTNAGDGVGDGDNVGDVVGADVGDGVVGGVVSLLFKSSSASTSLFSLQTYFILQSGGAADLNCSNVCLL